MEGKTKAVMRYGDAAMYAAEPLRAEDGPKLYLLSMTLDPLGSIAAACKMYKGEVVRNLADITDDERLEYFAQVMKTKLKAPFEFVKFHFMIEGVSRSLTHQMVRQRTAVYAQESLRFAVKEHMAEGVYMPPSLAGTHGGEPLGAEDSTEEWQRNVWDQCLDSIEQAYLHLIDSGMPAEDARGLLPHNITTRLHYSTDLRALLEHGGNRLCSQAQQEWKLVWVRIIEAIRNAQVYVPGSGVFPVYMANELAGLFRPVCFLTGQCEFRANFDRPCKIRERVDHLAKDNVPTSEWDQHIRPVEWLADPTIAR